MEYNEIEHCNNQMEYCNDINEIDSMIFSALAGKECDPPPGGWGPGECPPPGCPSNVCSWECTSIGCRDRGVTFAGAYHTLADCQADNCVPCFQLSPQPCGGSCTWMWFGNCEGNAWSIVTNGCNSSDSRCNCYCLQPTDESGQPLYGSHTGETTTTGCSLNP
jgi:hypothetical protein